MTGGDVLDHHVELDLFVLVDQVRLVKTNHWSVGWDCDHTELVGGHKLSGFGFRSTGHTRELLIHPEVVLQGDCCQRLVLSLDGYALFGFDGLVHALVVATTTQDTTGVLIHNLNFTVNNHVVTVSTEELFSANCVVQE